VVPVLIPPKKQVARPQSAYLFFIQSQCQELKEKNPELSPEEALKQIGAFWVKLSQEERKYFEDLAESDEKRYQQGLCYESDA